MLLLKLPEKRKSSELCWRTNQSTRQYSTRNLFTIISITQVWLKINRFLVAKYILFFGYPKKAVIV